MDMTTSAGLPPGTITYQQWLINGIENPGMICGPNVHDDRRWWQRGPLSPYRELEAQWRQAHRSAGKQAEHEAEAG